jgi:GMP synthase-like glutamine amidotransferase
MGKFERDEMRFLLINPQGTPEVTDWVAQAMDVPVEQFVTFDANSLPTKDELAEFAAVIGAGGKQSVTDPNVDFNKPYQAFLRTSVEMGLPHLLFCLSDQQLAVAHGGTVEKVGQYRYETTEVELTDKGRNDPLLHNIPRTAVVFSINEDYVTQLPPASSSLRPVVLANSQGHPNEAVSYSDRVKAVQWHLDRTAKRMRLLAKERYGELDRPEDARAAYLHYLENENPDKAREAERNTRQMATNFVDLIALPYHRSRRNRPRTIITPGRTPLCT